MTKQNPITPSVIKQGQTYTEYREMMEQLVAEGKTTGTNQSESMVGYTALNWRRTLRVEKTVSLNEALQTALKNLEVSWIWLVLAEAWCGDVPANLPVIAKMAELNDGIQLKIILRDEHPDVMNAYLTNGGKGIPKLACVDADTLEPIGSWGPRPAPAQKMVMDYKANPTEPYMEFVKKVQSWYAKDRGKTIQQEFLALLEQWRIRD